MITTDDLDSVLEFNSSPSLCDRSVMQKTTFYVGQGLNKDGKNIQDRLPLLRFKAFQHLAEEFGGFTAIPTYGGYKDHAGNLVLEDSLKIEILKNLSIRETENAAKFLRDTFEQEEVWYNTETVEEFGALGGA